MAEDDLQKPTDGSRTRPHARRHRAGVVRGSAAFLALACGLPLGRAAAPSARERLDRTAVFVWVEMDGREGLERCRRLHAGYVYRGWFNWAGQYPYLQRWVGPAVQDMGAVFSGGVTVPAYYPHQRVPEHFRDWSGREEEEWVTRSTRGEPTRIADAYYHGSLYHPGYREFVLANAQEQVDLGVDAIAFDEICGVVTPPGEGYDQACLDQFREYLLRKYAHLPTAAWQARFGIADPGTFDYRRYLADHGWLDDPETAANPLASEFGRYSPWLDGRANQYPYHEEGSFRRQAWLEFWQWLTSATRTHAREGGREVLVSANGLAPFTDLQEFALLFAKPGDLVGHLDGSPSVLDRWHSFVVDSWERYGLDVPVMGHHDYHDPAANPDMLDLPPPEQVVYLRLYSAEAYAAGGFYCFNQGGGGDYYSPDPATYATMDQLAGFYQQYASLYARCFPKKPFRRAVVTDTPHVTTQGWAQPELRRVAVHLINHNWDPEAHDVVPQQAVAVTLWGDLPAGPLRAVVVSPDRSEPVPVPVEACEGGARVTVLELRYYGVVVVEHQPTGPRFGELAGTVTESHGRPVRGATVSLWGTGLRARTDARGHFRFPRVPADGPAAGFYEVNAVASGYWPARASGVQVRTGTGVRQDLRVCGRALLDDFEAGVGAWFQMARPARPWAAGMRAVRSTCPDGGRGACVVSLSSAGSDGASGDQAKASRDTPVQEVVRGIAGAVGPEAVGLSFWARSLAAPARVQLVLRQYDSTWDLADPRRSPSQAAEVTVRSGPWQRYVVPFDSLRPLDGAALQPEEARLLLLRVPDEAPARIALDEITVCYPPA